MVLSEMIWAGPVRAALKRGSAVPVTVISCNCTTAGLSAKSAVRRWPRARKMDSRCAGSYPTARTSIRYGPPTDRYSMKYRPRALVVVLPPLAVGGVDDVDNRLLHGRAVHAEDSAIDGCAGDALRRERERGPGDGRPDT